MAASVFDSPHYARLFPTGDAGRLFTDSAEVRAMLLVEGALARVQGARGLIPADSAGAIDRAVMEVQIDTAALAVATGVNGVSVPGLVAALRTEMQAPEHAQYVHWGATSQDIIDTALMLRLRQALTLIRDMIGQVLGHLGPLARDFAGLPMPARTYGQHATPTSFGALVADWGAPLLSLTGELPRLREDCLVVSLGGAAGTASELGPDALALRADLAGELGLSDPGRSWHTDRTPLLRLADWMTRVTLALGKLGEDTVALSQTGIAEIRLGGAGASSTMPQKQNPVSASTLVALARHTAGQQAILQGAAIQRHQRDGAAWFTEWMCLPQIVLGAASAVCIAQTLCKTLAPEPDRMSQALKDGLGLIHAEALSFALATRLPRQTAQQRVKALCGEARNTGTPLAELVARDHPDLDVTSLFDPARQLGQAPQVARDFATEVAKLRAQQP